MSILGDDWIDKTYPHIVDSYDDHDEFDIDKVEILSVTNIDYEDYPDFCDAYVDEALYDGDPMTDEQYEILHDEYSDVVYDAVMRFALEQ